jgi:hypothetical protein
MVMVIGRSVGGASSVAASRRQQQQVQQQRQRQQCRSLAVGSRYLAGDWSSARDEAAVFSGAVAGGSSFDAIGIDFRAGGAWREREEGEGARRERDLGLELLLPPPTSPLRETRLSPLSCLGEQRRRGRGRPLAPGGR